MRIANFFSVPRAGLRWGSVLRTVMCTVWLNEAAHVIASNRWEESLERWPNPADRNWLKENQVYYLRVTDRMYVPHQECGAADVPPS